MLASNTHSRSKEIYLSVVIVTFNNLPEIEDCLQALVKAVSSYRTQVIIIDNHSTDGTLLYLEQQSAFFRLKFADFTVVRNSANMGFTRALNQGLAHCQGDYILILNPDVILSEHTIATLLDWLQQHKMVGVVAPQLRYKDGRIQPSCRRFPRKWDILLEVLPLKVCVRLGIPHWKMPEFDHRHSREVQQPQGAFLLMRKETLEQVGKWDERFFMFFSDVDWCRRVYEKGWQIWFIAETFAYHKKGASVAQSRPAMITSSHRSFIQYFAKYDRSLLQTIGTIIVYFILLIVLALRLTACFSRRQAIKTLRSS